MMREVPVRDTDPDPLTNTMNNNQVIRNISTDYPQKLMLTHLWDIYKPIGTVKPVLISYSLALLDLDRSQAVVNPVATCQLTFYTCCLDKVAGTV